MTHFRWTIDMNDPKLIGDVKKWGVNAMIRERPAFKIANLDFPMFSWYHLVNIYIAMERFTIFQWENSL